MVKETLIDKRIVQLENQIKITNDKTLKKHLQDKINLLKSKKQSITKQLVDKVKSFPEHVTKIIDAEQELKSAKAKKVGVKKAQRFVHEKMAQKDVDIVQIKILETVLQ